MNLHFRNFEHLNTFQVLQVYRDSIVYYKPDDNHNNNKVVEREKKKKLWNQSIR